MTIPDKLFFSLGFDHHNIRVLHDRSLPGSVPFSHKFPEVQKVFAHPWPLLCCRQGKEATLALCTESN